MVGCMQDYLAWMITLRLNVQQGEKDPKVFLS